jgi:hypothetical protein
MTNRVDFKPQTGSLADRVCSFFQRHREEELGNRDIATKFDAKQSSVTALLATATQRGWLRRTNGVYGAGPNLPEPEAAAAPVHTLMGWPPKPKAAAAPKRAYGPLDADAVAIVTGEPIPPERMPIEQTYLRLLERMPPGSMVELSVRQADVLRATAKKHGIPVTVRRHSEDVKRVWRLEAPKPTKVAKAA